MSASGTCVPRRMSKSLIVAQRRGTDRWREAANQFSALRTPDRSRPELVSEEVEFDVRIHPFALSISAVHDPCFGGMQFQAAFRQPRSKLGPEGFCFLLSPAVQQPVIGIPTPREVRMCPVHPEIECVVQEQIR